MILTMTYQGDKYSLPIHKTKDLPLLGNSILEKAFEPTVFVAL